MAKKNTASFEAVIIDKVGLHARPAYHVVTAASKFTDDEATITVESNGQSANLKSIMNVLSLGVQYNAKFKIITEGPKAEEAADAIKNTMVEQKLIAA